MAGIRLTCLDCGQANRVPQERLGAGPKCGTCGAALVPRKAVEVDLATLEKAVRLDGLPIVADFWAPWCGPCRMMAPDYAKAAERLAGQVRLVKLNTEAEPAAGARHAIRSIPTLVRFAGGREVGRQSGAVGAAAIAAFATGVAAAR